MSQFPSSFSLCQPHRQSFAPSSVPSNQSKRNQIKSGIRPQRKVYITNQRHMTIYVWNDSQYETQPKHSSSNNKQMYDSHFRTQNTSCLMMTLGKRCWVNQKGDELDIFLTVGGASKDIFWPTPGLQRDPLVALKFLQGRLCFLYPQCPLRGRSNDYC